MSLNNLIRVTDNGAVKKIWIYATPIIVLCAGARR
jgi:hypothetical protein